MIAPMSKVTRTHGFRTRAIHAGARIDPTTHSSAPPIDMSSTFLLDADYVDRGFEAEGQGGNDAPFIYARWGNPTARMLEARVASLENTEDALSFASGMAAATGLLLHLLHAGDHLVISDVSYVGVAEFVRVNLPRMGVAVTVVDSANLDELAAAIRPNTRLVYIETPANPILKLTDIAAAARIAHAAGSLLAVDSTFATPLATRPAELGADFVIHALTKYFCGHGDAMGGVVAGRRAAIEALRVDSGVHLGASLSPFNCWLIMRGIDTLALRMAAHEQNAMAIASFLERHPRVTRVMYPGLASHPQHDLARRQMANFSGMLTFQARDAHDLARAMASHLQVFHYAVSLGHQRSLVVHMDTAELMEKSFKLNPAHEARFRQFAGDGIFRMSVGLEDADDLCADLDQALGME